MLILTNNIFQNIKNNTSPEIIYQLFENEAKSPNFQLCYEEQIKYIKKEKEDKENLSKYVLYFQKKLVPKIKEDIVLYFFFSFLLENRLLIFTDKTLFFYPNIHKNNNYNKEAYDILKIYPQYTELFFDMIASFAPNVIRQLIVPNFSNDNTFLLILDSNSLRIALRAIYKKSEFRKMRLLTDILKIVLTKNNKKEIIDTVIESFHEIADYSRYDFLYEIKDIIEWSCSYPKLFEKLLDIGINDSDFYYLNNYEIECDRLCIEFERILKHPTLSNHSQNFYKNEIERLIKIKNVISNIKKRIVFLKTNTEKYAALKLQNAWYNHIQKICHPDHPITQTRLKNLYNDLEKK